MAEQIWDSFARLNAGERFKKQSAEMGSAVTEAIVEEARVAPGFKVLDLACGAGEPSISIAALLKGTGEVVGVDMAAEPLKVAGERARKRGLENVEYMQADVHALPFADASFDRVTSRLGVMFFGDLPRALGEMRRVLKPAGRVALLAWGAMEQPYFDMTVGTVRRMRPGLEVPATARQMFKFGVPGTLAGALREAGFAEAEDKVRSLRWDWHGSPEEMWDYFRGVTVPFRELLAKVEGDAEVDAAVLAALRERFDGEYVRIEAQMVVATGCKS
jgi:ubiquinone/menaquinone biosynthesis C-methylase UbiE